MSRRFLVLPMLAACGHDYDLSAPVDIDPSVVTACPFTEVPGTRFRSYDCNPVFTGSDEDWISGGGVGSVGFHAEMVLDHPFYQMWYATTRKQGAYGVGYAISADGVDWTPNPANPVWTDPGNGWNQDQMGAVTVVWDADGDEYVLAYQGINLENGGDGLGMLTSPDGLEWTPRNSGRPVLDMGGPLHGIKYCWPLALAHDRDAGFLGYIGGQPNPGPGDSLECQVYGYGGGTLDELSPTDQKVFGTGGGPHEKMGVSSAAVVKFDDTYYMFYVGIRDWQTVNQYFVSPLDTTLNIATSPDGEHWTRDEHNPYLELSLVTHPALIGGVAAQVVGRRIHLWMDDYYADLDANAVGYFLYEPDSDPF